MDHRVPFYGGSLLTAFAMTYGVVSWFAVRRPMGVEGQIPGPLPPATILKPLYGAERETYRCLLSFCEQRYTAYQIVFGVADAGDPAVDVVTRLQREWPQRDIQLAIDRRQHGGNRKVSNLINMMALARHDVLVMSDSDVRVQPNYLAKVVAPLSDPSVGVVTCLYRGCPRSGLWPLLGSMFINDWFAPSVRVAALSGSRAFAFGATIALRRDTLTRIGGFKSVANQLADDYRIGELARRLGLGTVLSHEVVETVVSDNTFAQLVQHELRWLRTIRAMNPGGYRFLFVTFGLPVSALGNWWAANSLLTLGMLGVTFAARILVYLHTRQRGTSWVALLLLPVRDLLSLGLWSWGFVTRRVRWRDAQFQTGRDGSMRVTESA